MNDFVVELIEYPTDRDWMEAKRRALVTVGKKPLTPPTFEWKRKILEARHSPIRRLHFAFYIECPYWLSVHLVRHKHAEPYVKTQRNDRQSDYDRNKAPQDQTVCMIWDMNAEELMIVANKRLCGQAAEETQSVVKKACALVIESCPEFKNLLVPMCVYHGGVCHEMEPCERYKKK